MTLQDEVLDSLHNLSYPLVGDASSLNQLSTFSQIVSWLSTELQVVAKLESSVNPIENESDMCAFQIELKSLLRELNSPFVEANITEEHHKLAILNHLCGHLMASRITYNNGSTKMRDNMTIALSESETAKDMRIILTLLGLSKPPDDIKLQLLFHMIKEAIPGKLVNLEDSLLLPNGLSLSPQQWDMLNSYHQSFLEDYSLRREMLLRRCECTVSSFKWKNNADPKQNEKIDEILESLKGNVCITPSVTMSDALAARQSDCNHLLNAIISATHVNCLITPESNQKANRGLQQQLQLHKFLIGQVPDRGGRPGEQPAPPRESFSQQKQQREFGGRGGRGGRGGGGGRGGHGYQQRDSNQSHQRVQGAGWNQNSSGGDRGNKQGNYNRNQQRDYDYQRQSSGGYETQQYSQQQYHPQQQQHSYHQQQPMYQNNQYAQQSQPYGRQNYQQGYQDTQYGYQQDQDYRQNHYQGGNRGRY